MTALCCTRLAMLFALLGPALTSCDGRPAHTSVAVDAWKARLLATDLAVVRVRPWTAMHLVLAFHESEKLLHSGGRVDLGWLLRVPPLEGFAPLLIARDGAPERTSESAFLYEAEDHYCQYYAYVAIGTMARPDGGTNSDWDALYAAFRSQSREDRYGELSWYLMLGACVARHIREVERQREVLERVEELLRTTRRPETPSCGGIHVLEADALCTGLPFTDAALRSSLRDRVAAFRETLQTRIDDEGGVNWPSLYRSLERPGDHEHIHALGHVIELIGLCGGPFSERERRLGNRVAQLLSDVELGPRSIGDCCHAVVGLALLGASQSAVSKM